MWHIWCHIRPIVANLLPHLRFLGATMLKMWQFFLSLIVAHLLDCVQLWQLQEFVPRRFRFHNFENVAIRFLPIVANVLDCV